tara:strand:+ start:138 stop:518 length:381 start_codon:yes stop_codon:yes gene_type:complete
MKSRRAIEDYLLSFEPKNFRQSASKVCNVQSALRFHHLFLIVFIFAFSDKFFHHKLTDSWETIIFKDENEEEEQKRRGRRGPFTPPPAQKLGERMRAEMRQHQSHWLFRQRARDEDTMVRVGCLRE